MATTASATAGGACAPGQIALADGAPTPSVSAAGPAAAPEGVWLITDNSADCACVLEFSRAIFGGNRVEPIGCRHPGLNMTARFALAGGELALIAGDGEMVMYRLRQINAARFEGWMNGRAVVMWQPPHAE